MRKVLSYIVFYFGLFHTCYPHVENEITYNLEGKELTVSLTPKTLVDLLLHYSVISRDESNVDLTKYTDFYTDYFNEHISLETFGRKVGLSFISADLNSHESKIVLYMEKDVSEAESLKISIRCFLEVYQRPVNFVRWKLKEGVIGCNLNKNVTECDFGNQSIDGPIISRKQIIVISGIAILIIAAIIYRVKIKGSSN